MTEFAFSFPIMLSMFFVTIGFAATAMQFRRLNERKRDYLALRIDGRGQDRTR